MKGKGIELLWLMCAATLWGGCASIISHSDRTRKPSVYPGIQDSSQIIHDAWTIDEPGFGGLARFESVALMLDWPFSFALDTVLIPFDIIRVVTHKEPVPNQPVEPRADR